MTVDLSNQERRAMIDHATRIIAQQLIEEQSGDLVVLSASQVCGILDVTPKTLADLPIPKIDLLGNARAIRYRASDVADYLNEKTIREVTR